MKIAIWHNLGSGGAKRALYYQVRGLLRRGHILEAWCPPSADQSYLPLSELIPEHVVPLEWQPRMARTPPGKLRAVYLSPLERMAAMDRHCHQCADQIKAAGFDLLFVHPCRHYRAPFITRHSAIPALLYLQEPYRLFYEAQPVLAWLPRQGSAQARPIGRVKQFVREALRLHAIQAQAREERVNIRAAGHVLVNSYYSRESVLRVYGREATVCYLGIDTQLFCDQGLPRESFVAGLGSFDRLKGVDRALKLVARLPEPRSRLVWVGNGGQAEYLNEMTGLARRLHVDFEPRMHVSDSEVVDILNRAALLLYTSRLEPFGFAPLEASACGTPVIAVAEGGVRETVRNGVNGFLVDYERPETPQILERLLRDSAAARQLGQSGRDYVLREWNLEDSIDRLETCIHEFMHGQYAGLETDN